MSRYALITGASSGIGREMARKLAKRGYDLILVARRQDRLEQLKDELGRVEIIATDLSREEDILKLHENIRGKNIEILINNAGFGDLGEFTQTNLNKEMQMVDVNVKAVHILTKLFLKDMEARNKGYILNVASVAGILPAGPYMATYYATKSYVTSLTMGIAEELRQKDSKVYIGALCPGPVDTEFNEVANCSFALKGINPKTCARIGLREMFKKKEVIIPNRLVKTSMMASKLLPKKLVIKFCAKQQKRKEA